MNLHDALDRAGMTWPRSNKIRCPLHNDKTPSLHLYEKTNSWTCFSCQRNGDGYGLYAALTGQHIDDVLRAFTTPNQQAKLAPKANPAEIERRQNGEFVEITQRLFDTVRYDMSLEGWQKDLLLDDASRIVDTARAEYEAAAPFQRAAVLHSIAERIDHWLLVMQLKRPTRGHSVGDELSPTELAPTVPDHGGRSGRDVP